MSATTFLGLLTYIDSKKNRTGTLEKVAKLHLHPLPNLIDIQVRFHYGFPQDCGSGSIRVLMTSKVFWFPTGLAVTKLRPIYGWSASFKLQPFTQDPVKNRNSYFVTWTIYTCLARSAFSSLSQSPLSIACSSSIFWRGIGTCSRAQLISYSTWPATHTPCTPWRVTSINW